MVASRSARERKAAAQAGPLARVRIEVAPATDGCVVRIAEDAEKGPGTLVPRPVRSAVIGPRNVEALRRLAYLAERRNP